MILLTIYVVSLVIGGILLAASLFLGHGHGDAGDVDVAGDLEADAAAGLDHDLDSDAGHDAGHDVEGAGLSDFWLPFISIRFWVFFLCFFGLTGTVFSLLGLAGRWATLAVAIVIGLLVGFAAAFIIQNLRKSEVGLGVTEEDMKGHEAMVLLPIGPGSRGKIRLELRGQLIDLIARTSEERPRSVERGRRVLIIDFDRHEAIVEPASYLEDDERQSEAGSRAEDSGGGATE